MVFIAAGDSRYLGQSGPDFPVLCGPRHPAYLQVWGEETKSEEQLEFYFDPLETRRSDQGFLHLNTELTHSRNIIVNCVDGGIVVDVVAAGCWLTKVKS